MAAATVPAKATRRNRSLAPLWLLIISAVAFLYIYFLFQVVSDPSVRDLGFGTKEQIERRSALLLAFLLALVAAVEMLRGPSKPPAAAAGATAPAAPQAAGVQAKLRALAEDPASRPGAPPSFLIPAVAPDVLEGGWKRFKFPAERTGGLYVDTDIVTDDGTGLPLDPSTPRGRIVLRMREEVARVCVRCALLEHCHGYVATVLTREEMKNNHECVPGLKKMVSAKLEAIRRARAGAQVAPAAAQATAIFEPPAAAAPEAAPAPEAGAPPAGGPAAQPEGDGGPAPEPDSN